MVEYFRIVNLRKLKMKRDKIFKFKIYNSSETELADLSQLNHKKSRIFCSVDRVPSSEILK
jgi:hypothetical protein